MVELSWKRHHEKAVEQSMSSKNNQRSKVYEPSIKQSRKRRNVFEAVCFHDDFITCIGCKYCYVTHLIG